MNNQNYIVSKESMHVGIKSKKDMKYLAMATHIFLFLLVMIAIILLAVMFHYFVGDGFFSFSVFSIYMALVFISIGFIQKKFSDIFYNFLLKGKTNLILKKVPRGKNLSHFDDKIEGSNFIVLYSQKPKKYLEKVDIAKFLINSFYFVFVFIVLYFIIRLVVIMLITPLRETFGFYSINKDTLYMVSGVITVSIVLFLLFAKILAKNEK